MNLKNGCTYKKIRQKKEVCREVLETLALVHLTKINCKIIRFKQIIIKIFPLFSLKDLKK
jgi:hypothetical protein